MKNKTKLATAIGITAVLVVALAIGGWFLNTAFAQGPWPGGYMGMGHNNQAVFDLLKINESDLLKERQAGKSWLDIATAKDVTEQALTGTLLQPMGQIQTWMIKNYPQSNPTQMTDWMRQQIAQDIRVAQYGTMTDMHVFGGSMMNGLMGNSNGYGGMMNGNGMMGIGNSFSFGGMMGGGMMGGGMMGSGNSAPNVNATPVPSTQKVDQEVNLAARNFKYDPTRVEVKKGETIKLNITNQDTFAHNAVSQDGKLAYTLLPASQTSSIVWVAPKEAGTLTVICTFHPGMQFTIVVE